MVMRTTSDHIDDPQKVEHYCDHEGSHTAWDCMCPCETCEECRKKASAATEVYTRPEVGHAIAYRPATP